MTQYRVIEQPQPEQPKVFKVLQQEPAPQEQPSILDRNISAVKKFPGSLAEVFKDMGTAIASPIDTSKAITTAVTGVVQKLDRKIEEGMTGQELPRGDKEQTADAIGKVLVDRYGSFEAFLNTMENDPAGALLDLSGVLQASRVPTLVRAGRNIEPTGAIGRAAIKTIPENAATSLYQSAAKFSTTQFGKTAKGLEARKAATQTALDEGLMPTHRGVRKMDSAIDVLDAQLDELIDTATAAGTRIPADVALAHINDLIRQKGGFKLEAEGDVAKVREIVGEFHRKHGGKDVTPEELQAFKRDLYDKINFDRKNSVTNLTVEDTRKAMARASKDELNRLIPESSDLNARLGELLELQPHLVQAANRLANRNFISLDTGVKVGAGGGVGAAAGMADLGVGIGLITAVLGNPRVKARVAIALNRMKQGDMGWINKNLNKPEVRVALALAGRAQEIVGDLQTGQKENQQTDLPPMPEQRPQL